MPTYGEVTKRKKKLRLRRIIIADLPPTELNPVATWVLLDGMSPMPESGWLYRPAIGDFVEPPVAPRYVTNEMFWDRFTNAEKEDLVDHSNRKVRLFLYELRIRSRINLDNAALATILTAMENAGILSAGRAAEILS